MQSKPQDASQDLRTARVIAILRGNFNWNQVAEIADILIENDFSAIEYTWNSPNAAHTISRLQEQYGDSLMIGAGTLLTEQHVREAAEAGSELFITPHWNEKLSDQCRNNGWTLLPGVFTPSEVQTARSHGWKLQKMFPASTGGPTHLRALKGPFPDVDFVATGGVDTMNARNFLDAGAAAVAIGSSVFRPGLSCTELMGKVRQLRKVVPRKAFA